MGVVSIMDIAVHGISLQQQQLFYGPLSGTTQVTQYQKNHSPTHTLSTSFILPIKNPYSTIGLFIGIFLLTAY